MENNNLPNKFSPNRYTLESLKKWLGFVGIMTIISGVFVCISAIGTFGISLIPGIITIILGVKLLNAKKSIENFLMGHDGEMNNIFDNLTSYFKIQGILMIISLVFMVLMIVFGGLMMFSFMGSY